MVDLVSLVDDIGTELSMAPVHLSRSSYIQNAISSGSLTYDLISGGGFPPGRIIVFRGFEASGKSTFAFTSLNSAINQEVLAVFIDAEGAADPMYMSRIGIDLDVACGKKDNKKNIWIERPKLLWCPPESGEQVFRFIKRVLEGLPDKIQTPSGDYFYLDAKGKKTKAKPGIEIFFLLDSYAALIPEDLIEKDDQNPTAMQARMFSTHLRLIKSQLSKKSCALFATNQMRKNPLQRFGNPNYEPGGFAVAHYTDLRCELTNCAVPKWRGTGRVEEEPCWDGIGIEKYHYTILNIIKNKMFSPFRKSVLRICFEKKGKPGNGIDPVFDTWQYLAETGQGVYHRGWYTIKTPFFDKKLRWPDFKTIISDPDSDFMVREQCRKQIEDGTAFGLYFDTAGKVAKVDDDDDKKTCGTCVQYKSCKKENDIKKSSATCTEYSEEVVEVAGSFNGGN